MGRAGAARLGSCRVTAPCAATAASSFDVWDRARFVSRSLGASPAGALMQGSRRNGLSGSSLASSTLQLLPRCRIDALWAARLRYLWMDGHVGRGRGYGTGR